MAAGHPIGAGIADDTSAVPRRSPPTAQMGTSTLGRPVLQRLQTGIGPARGQGSFLPRVRSHQAPGRARGEDLGAGAARGRRARAGERIPARHG